MLSECDSVEIESMMRRTKGGLFMARLLDGRIYVGFGNDISIYCRECKISPQ